MVVTRRSEDSKRVLLEPNHKDASLGFRSRYALFLGILSGRFVSRTASIVRRLALAPSVIRSALLFSPIAPHLVPDCVNFALF